MYYPCSKTKGADQLCSYCTADLRLCFRTGKNPVFSRRGFKFYERISVHEANHDEDSGYTFNVLEQTYILPLSSHM